MVATPQQHKLWWFSKPWWLLQGMLLELTGVGDPQ